MSFSIFESDIVLCSGDNVIVYNIQTNSLEQFSVPKPDNVKENSSQVNEETDNYHTITNVVFSNDGNYLAICTNRKQLCLFNWKIRKICGNLNLNRTVSKIRFTPDNNIVIADKSGDAYLYPTIGPKQELTFLQGSLSMLLDILVTRNNKYLIIANRDEKIQVSKFPNSYNIVSYCLGHDKFVTTIEELPMDGFLISGGGDGFLRVWNYKNGEEIQRVNLADQFLEEDIKEFNESLKKFDVDERELILPVRKLQILTINEKDCIVVASFYCNNKILIYKLLGEKLNIDFVEVLTIDNDLLECYVDNYNLWILTVDNVILYQWKGNSFVRNDEINCKLRILNETWKNLRINATSGTLVPILYKRKYDNVQEYKERKKMRLNKIMEA